MQRQEQYYRAAPPAWALVLLSPYSYLNTTPDGVATLSRVTPRTIGLRVSAEF